MAPYKCSKCKLPIGYKNGLCSVCRELKFQDNIDKQIEKRTAKYKKTKEYGISEVKKYADGKFWATSHGNCFRCTIPKEGNVKQAESMEHIKKKFERWLYHKMAGRIVYCELRLKEGYGRPDLIIIDTDCGSGIWVEEIVCSEKEASIVLKRDKYPWPIAVIKVDKNEKTK